ncbi:MAG: acyl carrier protein [Chitinophagales bacterium]|mgnify:CR=1 FL=1|nr:acyl carrier protein [Chitinophagales bacterium]
MTIEDVSHKINEFLAEEFETDIATITPDAPLKETLELDSLDYIDLVVILEGNFGIKVKQEEFTSIVTFNDLYQYVISKM